MTSAMQLSFETHFLLKYNETVVTKMNYRQAKFNGGWGLVMKKKAPKIL